VTRLSVLVFSRQIAEGVIRDVPSMGVDLQSDVMICLFLALRKLRRLNQLDDTIVKLGEPC
jgi:hypothetical protein